MYVDAHVSLQDKLCESILVLHHVDSVEWI